MISGASWPSDDAKARLGPYRYEFAMYAVLQESGEPSIYKTEDEGDTWDTFPLGTSGTVTDTQRINDDVVVVFLVSNQIRIAIFDLSNETWGSVITSSITVVENSRSQRPAYLVILDDNDYLVFFQSSGSTGGTTYLRVGIARYTGSWSSQTRFPDTTYSDGGPDNDERDWEITAASRMLTAGVPAVATRQGTSPHSRVLDYFVSTDALEHRLQTHFSLPDTPTGQFAAGYDLMGSNQFMWQATGDDLGGDTARLINGTIIASRPEFATGRFIFYARSSGGAYLRRRITGLPNSFIQNLGMRIWRSSGAFGSGSLRVQPFTAGGSVFQYRSIASLPSANDARVAVIEVRDTTGTWYVDAHQSLASGSWSNPTWAFNGGEGTWATDLAGVSTGDLVGLGTTHPGDVAIEGDVEFRVLYGNPSPMTWSSWHHIADASTQVLEPSSLVVSSGAITAVSAGDYTNEEAAYIYRIGSDVFYGVEKLFLESPENLLVTPTGEGSLLATWDPVDGASSYEVQRELYNREGDPV